MRILLPLFLIGLPVFGHDTTYPKFEGEIHFTRPNSEEFITFVDENLDKVVFLDLLFTADFGVQTSYDMEEACNSHFNFWDDGMEEQNIFLPIYEPDPENPPTGEETFEMDQIGCEMLSIRFENTALQLSSAGPGVHWSEIEGFFLLRSRSDRWPYLEIKELEASAETWAQILNK